MTLKISPALGFNYRLVNSSNLQRNASNLRFWGNECFCRLCLTVMKLYIWKAKSLISCLHFRIQSILFITTNRAHRTLWICKAKLTLTVLAAENNTFLLEIYIYFFCILIHEFVHLKTMMQLFSFGPSVFSLSFLNIVWNGKCNQGTSTWK